MTGRITASHGWALPWAPSLLLLCSPVPKLFTEHTLCALSDVLRGVRRQTKGAPHLGDAIILLGEAGLEMSGPTWPAVMSCEKDTESFLSPSLRRGQRGLPWGHGGCIRARGEERRWQEIAGAKVQDRAGELSIVCLNKACHVIGG